MRFYLRKLENKINVVFGLTQFDLIILKTGGIKTVNVTYITIGNEPLITPIKHLHMYKTFSYFTHGFEHKFLNELFLWLDS